MIQTNVLYKKNRALFSYDAFLLVLLGMLTAFGPFVTDMYLPSLPSMEAYFATTSSMVQLGLTFSMIGLAVGQIIFGPLSDKYGRRPLLLASMWLFIISTVACVFAPTIFVFVVLRVLQGIGGAGGIVISRSIATDRYGGKELAKMLAVIGAINGIAPVTAPVIGGLLTEHVGWQGIFGVLLALGLVLLAGCFRFRESLPLSRRSSKGLLHTFGSFKTIVRNRRYLFYVLQLGFAQGVLFGYIASSPFIIQQHYGFSPFMFSICFGINAVAIGIAAALSVKFRSQERGTRVGCVGMCVLAVSQLVALYMNVPFWVYEMLMIALLFVMGLTFTTSTSLAMSCERDNAGGASALLGAICFAFGGIVSPLVGVGNILVSTGVVFVVCAVCSLLCALYAERWKVR